MDKNYILKNADKMSVDTNGPLMIPVDVYKDFKRCHHCHSVFIDDGKCEACGVNLSYTRAGEPFGLRSYYGLKEKYVESLPLLVGLYPFFENKKSLNASSYIRQLTMRFSLILDVFAKNELQENQKKRLFYLELKDLIQEMVSYGKDVKLLTFQVENILLETHPLLAQELLSFLGQQVNIENKSLLVRIGEIRVQALSIKFWIFCTLGFMGIIYFAVLAKSLALYK